MPIPTDPASRPRPQAQRAGEVLSFAGALLRGDVASLWKQLPPLQGVRTLDLREVSAIDSAGLAFVSMVTAEAGASAVEGDPPGLAELRSAYRLGSTLDFVSA